MDYFGLIIYKHHSHENELSNKQSNEYSEKLNSFMSTDLGC